jgi:hypothetical protein
MAASLGKPPAQMVVRAPKPRVYLGRIGSQTRPLRTLSYLFAPFGPYPRGEPFRWQRRPVLMLLTTLDPACSEVSPLCSGIHDPLSREPLCAMARCASGTALPCHLMSPLLDELWNVLKNTSTQAERQPAVLAGWGTLDGIARNYHTVDDWRRCPYEIMERIVARDRYWTTQLPTGRPSNILALFRRAFFRQHLDVLRRPEHQLVDRDHDVSDLQDSTRDQNGESPEEHFLLKALAQRYPQLPTKITDAMKLTASEEAICQLWFAGKTRPEMVAETGLSENEVTRIQQKIRRWIRANPALVLSWL